MPFDLLDHTVLLTVAGSRAYGIHTASSDVDVKGVAVPPREYFLGFLHRFEQADSAREMAVFLPLLSPEERAAAAREKVEGTVYHLVKLVALASDCNPNILDVLFCRDQEVRRETPVGRRLREHRGLFLSAKARHSYSGYATAQLKRIRGHRKWLLEPPEGPPTRAAHGLPERPLIPADQLAAARAAVQKQVDRWEIDWASMPDSEKGYVQNQITEHLGQIGAALGLQADDARWLAAARTVGLDENLILVMQREREYEAAARHFRQYAHWLRSRNPVRAALEAEHGYDTKHGAHLYRLLKMCREILGRGELNVWRGDIDASEIRAIRNGAWPYERLVEWAESEDRALAELHARGAYAVPEAPDREAIDRLLISLVEEHLGLS